MKHARADYQDRIVDTAELIPADEPVFLLRGQDVAAPEALRAYAFEAARRGAGIEVVATTLAHAQRMDEWQKTVKSKTPDLASEEKIDA